MPAYRALIEGRNFHLSFDGKTRRYGFFQTVFIRDSSPANAEAAAIQAVKDDADLNRSTQNERDDPPMLYLDSLYEIEDSEPLPSAEGRTYFVEKQWWQFWK